MEADVGTEGIKGAGAVECGNGVWREEGRCRGLGEEVVGAKLGVKLMEKGVGGT